MAARTSGATVSPTTPQRAGLVDVADPIAEELQRGQLRLVDRVRRSQDGEVVLDRADHALFSQRALVVIDAGRITREIDKLLRCMLPRRVGPIA
jgi:hypothetical protein